MRTENLPDLVDWIAAAGLSADHPMPLLEGFCARATDAGLPLSRAIIGVDTLHPVLAGSVFEWQRGGEAVRQEDYARGDAGASDEYWLNSPFYRLYTGGEDMLRRRLDADCDLDEFSVLPDLHERGITDYVAMVCRFGDTAIGEMDCVFSSWSTDRPDGFEEAELKALQRLVPILALAVKGVAVGRIAETLVETYLGRDAGRRVLRGNIARGVAETIGAVLWFSDLRGFTRIIDTTPADGIIPLLSDYADAIVSAIHEHDGQVLKFVGDGILAIFSTEDPVQACQRALSAADEAQVRVTALNERRRSDGLPTSDVCIALHLGEMFYGNIGSLDRLDFTVVGPAVNEASRIEALGSSLDQLVVVSAAFAEAAAYGRNRLVSLGRYALRGVGRPQELFTLDPESRRY